MGSRRNLTAVLAATSLILWPSTSLGQDTLKPGTIINTVDSIVIDIPLDNKLGFYIFDDYVNTCWKAKKILVANGLDTNYACSDSVLAKRNIRLAENLLDDDITKWIITYTMIDFCLSQDSVRNNPDSILKLNARYHGIYEDLLEKYPFFREVMLRDDSLDGVY